MIRAALTAYRLLHRRPSTLWAGLAAGVVIPFVLTAGGCAVLLVSWASPAVPGSATPTGAVTGGPASCLPAAQAARNAGITDRSQLIVAVAVATAESGCDVRRLNPNPPDLSYCAWQINMIDGLGPARRAQYGLASNDDLYDWATCARVMFALSGGGTNWQPWSTYTSGIYRAALADAQATVDSLLLGASPDMAPGTLVALPAEWCTAGVDCRLDAAFAPGVLAMLQSNPFGLRVMSAYRPPSLQAELYARNCPTPDCPGGLTAAPGASLHGQGLAVDLSDRDGNPVEYGDALWNYLKVYGEAYGLRNLLGRSDSPHWSRTGR